MNSLEIISCAVCGHTDRLYSCSRCTSIFYCSREHQKKHWKKHKVFCAKPMENENAEGGSGTTFGEKRTQFDQSELLTYSITSPRTPISNQFSDNHPSTSRSATNFENSPTLLEGQLTPPATPDNEKKCIEVHNSDITSPKGVHEKSGTSDSIPQYGSAESEILATAIERLCFYPTNLNSNLSNRRAAHKQKIKTNIIPGISELRQRSDPAFQYSTPVDEMVNIIIEDLNAHGLCVLDDFCGPQIGKAVLEEVLHIYSKGIFQDGQLVSKSKNDAQSIRSDKILWVDGKEPHCKYIGQVLKKIDALIMKANKTPKNGKLGCYNINGRTKVRIN